MRSVCLFLVLFICLCATKTSVAEICPKDKCVSADQCESLWKGAECEETGKTCCSSLRREFRTTCRHHGGECLKWCNNDLRRDDNGQCPAGTMCCVLV